MTPSEVAAFLWQSGYEAGLAAGVDQGRRIQRAVLDEAADHLAHDSGLDVAKSLDALHARQAARRAPVPLVPTVEQCLASWTENAA